MKTHEANVYNLAGYIANLDAIANPNSVFADQEKIGHDRHNDVLQGYGDARGDQSGKSYNRTHLRGERQENNHNNCHPHHHPADQKELVAAADVMNVAERCSSPDFTDSDDRPNQRPEHRQAEQQLPALLMGLELDGFSPAA